MRGRATAGLTVVLGLARRAVLRDAPGAATAAAGLETAVLPLRALVVDARLATCVGVGATGGARTARGEVAFLAGVEQPGVREIRAR